MSVFHETRFPDKIARGAQGGPERRTDIVAMSSGFEERNQRWAHSKRTYDVGYGVKNVSELFEILEFFEERRGQLHGFRFKDFMDYNSTNPKNALSLDDQVIAAGDGSTTDFQVYKTYGSVYSPYVREIKKLVSGTLLVGVNGLLQTITTDYTVDLDTGIVTFNFAPANGAVISCGYEFDVPVRFADERIVYSLDSCEHGQFPNIKVMEIRI